LIPPSPPLPVQRPPDPTARRVRRPLERVLRSFLAGSAFVAAVGCFATPTCAQDSLEEFVGAVSRARSARDLTPVDARWIEPAMRIASTGRAEAEGEVLDMGCRALVLDALGASPPESWRAVVDGWSTPVEALRLGGLLVIANHGDATDLERAQALCERPGDTWREEFRTTCARLFDRDGAFESVATKQLWYLPLNLGEELIHATADVGGAPAYEFLERVLRGREEHWPVALADLFRMAQKRSWELPEDLLDYVEGLLRSHDPATRREACKVLGLGAHAPAAAALIERLDDEAPGVAHAAHWALERAFAQKLPPEPARWRAWLGESREWWSKRSSRAFDELAGDDPQAALAALKELARQRYRRREITRVAVPVLLSPDPVLAEVAAGLIGRLGDGSEAPELIAALGRPEVRVRTAAGSALRKLFDARIEDDPVAWSRYWRQQQGNPGR
jgi:hypothetical protein